MNDSMKGIYSNDIPNDFFKSVQNTIIDYMIGIVRITENKSQGDALLIGSGTLVDIDGNLGILTAQHVIDALPSNGNLGFIMAEHLHSPLVDVKTLSYTHITKGDDPLTGPDIGFIKLPNTIIGLLKAYKSFYNISKRRERILCNPPANDLGLWCLSGIPNEKTVTEGPSRGFEIVKCFLEYFGFGGISNYSILNEFDYFDFDVYYNERTQTPQDFRGVSGGGLWHLLLDKDKNGQVILKEFILSGVAFYQLPLVNNKRIIKCHGRRSIYDKIYNVVIREFT